jgi:hypothetical protein
MPPGNFVSTPQEAELDRLLAMIERHVDLDHCREVDRRYRATLACEPVDRPPLVVRPPFAAQLQLPAPWDAFTLYPHRQAYNDPVAMMQNQLLGSVVPGMLLEDDHRLLMDEDRVYAQTVARRGPFTNHRPPREELLNGHARRRFPTGVVFTYEPRDFDDAREVVRTFRKT